MVFACSKKDVISNENISSLIVDDVVNRKAAIQQPEALTRINYYLQNFKKQIIESFVY